MDIDARDAEGRTPLQWAAEFQQTETAAMVMAAGANVNAKDEDDGTPLHVAAGRVLFPV